MNINMQEWQRLVDKVGREEASKRLETKKEKLREVFTPDRTVTQVLKMLRGLNGVKPMALNELYKYYGVNSLNPLEELADGMCYTFPGEHTADYLIQRNDENMGYVIDIDNAGL